MWELKKKVFEKTCYRAKRDTVPKTDLYSLSLLIARRYCLKGGDWFRKESEKAMKKDTERGSMTVEAAFIFPIVFFVVLALCYFTFFMCDRVKLQATVNTLVQEQAVCVKDNTVLGKKRDYANILDKGVFYYLSDLSGQKAAFNKNLQSQAKKALIMGNITKVESNVTHTKINATVTVNVNIGISQVKEYLTGTPLQYQITANAPVHNPAEFARGYLAMGETLDGVKGVDAIKKKIKDILKVK